MPQGPIPVATALTPGNVQTFLRTDKQTNLKNVIAHPEYYTAAFAGAVGFAANPSGVTTSVALATTYVGLCLSNPAGSKVNLSVQRVSGSFIVAPSIITGINLITGYSAAGIVTHTTPLTTYNGLVGTGAVLVGLVDSACTLVGTPVYSMPVAQSSTATTAPFFNVDLAGAILLPPGAYLAIGTTIAGPSSGFQGGIMWQEIPV